MTDITATAPTPFPTVRALLLGLGRGLGTMLHACSEAIELAHMAPGAGPAKRRRASPGG